jgi:hypothetical protein
MKSNEKNIFIASSNELSLEREKCIIVVNEINKIRNEVHLTPVEWEYDVLHGRQPSFSNIQDAINPKLKKSECVIFIFYSKIGKFTVQEYELAVSLKKPIYIFFKMGFTPLTKMECDLYGELLDFKDSLSNELLYRQYKSIEHFELLLKDDLHFYITELLVELGNKKKLTRTKKAPSNESFTLKTSYSLRLQLAISIIFCFHY